MSTKRTDAAAGTSDGPATKKLRVDGKELATPFTKDTIPPHHYHLGDDLFVTVQNFAGTTRVHLRQFTCSDIGEYTPSKEGIALPPFLWQSLAESFDKYELMDLSKTPNEFCVLRNCLFLGSSYVEKDRTLYISLQRFYMRKDFSRVFLPGVCAFTPTQWSTLIKLRHVASEAMCTLYFGPLLRYHLLTEATRDLHPDSDLSDEDARDALSASMIEMLCSSVSDNINELFECSGCRDNQANQLGHECMTYERDLKFARYFNLAISKINVKDFAVDFVKQNVALKRFIGTQYLKRIESKNLFQSIRDLYLSSV